MLDILAIILFPIRPPIWSFPTPLYSCGPPPSHPCPSFCQCGRSLRWTPGHLQVQDGFDDSVYNYDPYSSNTPVGPSEINNFPDLRSTAPQSFNCGRGLKTGDDISQSSLYQIAFHTVCRLFWIYFSKNTWIDPKEKCFLIKGAFQNQNQSKYVILHHWSQLRITIHFH